MYVGLYVREIHNTKQSAVHHVSVGWGQTC